MATRVFLERGHTWTFACALDWPGWARRGKGDEEAVAQLLAYGDRYGAVVAGVARDFTPGDLLVVGAVAGTATTDFGAPDVRTPWDDEPLDDPGANRLADLIEACWEAFDAVVAAAPAELRKGPRGGGRDRDAVAQHVQEAERSYSRKLGAAIRPRTPWQDQRDALVSAVLSGAPEGVWPVRYAVRRLAWHVLDHTWEIEDRAQPS